MQLDNRNPDTLYRQLVEDIRSKIEVGMWPRGSRLPPEYELTKQYGVSRATVRRALEILSQEGIIHKSQGRGTFAASQLPMQEELEGMASLSDVFYQRGIEPRVTILDLRLLPAPGPVAEKLEVEPGTPVLYVLRRHSIDDEHVALARIHLPQDLGRQVSQGDLERHTTYWLLENRCGVKPAEGSQVIRASAAGGQDVAHLSVRPGSPLLVMERTTYATDGMPLEHIVISFVGERYRYRIKLRSRSHETPE